MFKNKHAFVWLKYIILKDIKYTSFIKVFREYLI